MKPDIHRLMEFQELLNQFSDIDRIVHRKQKGKFIQENDTEHSYNLAMAGWYLSAWFPELDKNLIIQYGLVHDLVEVHAGDTFIYGAPEELESKVAREAKSLKKLEKDWPDFKAMTAMIHEYEKRDSPEARFIYALDKVMAPMVIYLNEGYSFKKHNVTVEMIHDYKLEKVKISPEILPYFMELYNLLLEHPEVLKES